MITEVEVVNQVEGLEPVTLRRWIEVGWIEPAGKRGGYLFREVDLARIRLVHEIVFELRVEEDNVPLILQLLDQVYDLRRRLRALAGAIAEEPEDIRARIAERLSEGSR